MKESFDTFVRVKNVVVLHFLRRQIDHDILQVRTAQLLLKRSYLNQLERIHQEALSRIVHLKRTLRTQGVKVIFQKQSKTEFTISYVEKGYQHSHSFRMEPLLAEVQLAFDKLSREPYILPPSVSGTDNHIVVLPAPIQPLDHSP